MSLLRQNGVNMMHLSNADKLSSATVGATFQAGLDLLTLGAWKDTKRYNEKDGQVVQCSKLPARTAERERLHWYRRTSEHSVERDLSYEEFRTGLLLVLVVQSRYCFAVLNRLAGSHRQRAAVYP